MRAIGCIIGSALIVAGCASQDAATPTPAAPARAAPVSAAAPAPTGQHWLVGRWRGEITGIASDSGRRTLTVTNVAPDGAVTGRYQGQAVPMALSGDTLRFTSTGSVNHELRRTGPNTMQGTFLAGRTSRGYTMTRE